MADVNRITGFPRELLAAPAKLSAADSGPLPARRLPEFMERALAKKAAERAANDADVQSFLNAIDEAQKDPVPDTLMPLAEAAASLGKTVPQLLRGLKGMPPRKRRSWEYTVIDDQAYVARAAVAEALAIGDSGQI